MSHMNGFSKSTKRFNDRDLYVAPTKPFKLATHQEFSAIVQRSDLEQQVLRDLVQRDRVFSERERAALRLDSASAFNVFWNSTMGAQVKFEENHKSGAKLVMRNLQNFGESAADVLNQMEPLIQAVRDFGSPSGNMAIGTIAFFFTVKRSLGRMRRSC